MNKTIKKLSRRTDPQTSKDAAKKLVESGGLNYQQKVVKELLFMYSHGITAKELGMLCFRIDRYVCCRRLPELKAKGLAYTKGRRNGERIWFPNKNTMPYIG
jgi:hypothetical protein